MGGQKAKVYGQGLWTKEWDATAGAMAFATNAQASRLHRIPLRGIWELVRPCVLSQVQLLNVTLAGLSLDLAVFRNRNNDACALPERMYCPLTDSSRAPAGFAGGSR